MSVEAGDSSVQDVTVIIHRGQGVTPDSLLMDFGRDVFVGGKAYEALRRSRLLWESGRHHPCARPTSDVASA